MTRRLDIVTGQPLPKRSKVKAEPLTRLSIPELEAKLNKLEMRCKLGANKVLFMKMDNDPRFNLASAFLGQLQAERDRTKKELDNALAWEEAGWEE